MRVTRTTAVMMVINGLCRKDHNSYYIKKLAPNLTSGGYTLSEAAREGRTIRVDIRELCPVIDELQMVVINSK